MIRDPSDSTIKQPLDETSGFAGAAALNANDPNNLMLSTTSGLPATSSKLDYLERLEASREWLKSYMAPKQNAEDA